MDAIPGRPPEPHYTQVIRHITGDAWFLAGFGENFPESESPFPGINGGLGIGEGIGMGLSARLTRGRRPEISC